MSLEIERNSRILIIDDQQSIHDAFRTILEKLSVNNDTLDSFEAALFDEPIETKPRDSDFGLDYAHQGEQGFEKVRTSVIKDCPFALAFVDMRMPPGWDGLQTIEELWKVDPELQVVICTAFSDYKWDEVLQRLGRSDKLLFLKKPFTNEEVYQLAVAMTEKWRLTKDLQKQVISLQESNAQLENEITNRNAIEGKLRHMAYFDRLTNLPNRFVLTERLERSLAKNARNPGKIDALFFLDIDDFKLINDSLGHNTGDALLVQVAARLNQHLRECDTIAVNREAMAARLGGDEFVILLEDLRSPQDAAVAAKRLNQLLGAPYNIYGQEVMVGTSIGIAIVDDSVTNAEEVFRNADIAMYQAKFSGKNRFALFDSEMHNAVVARLELERDLRAAVENNEFELHLQPIVSLDSMQISKFEALVRWRNRDGRLIPPDSFIKLAEETGLIVQIGRWVIEEACRTLKKWNDQSEGQRDVSISVNVSKRQFAEDEFIEDVRTILEANKTPGCQLHIEVTESVVMHNPENVVKKLRELRELGIEIHMDDFGTGQSSLSCLHQFPIDVLKIDRSFIPTMESNASYASIVETIIILAHNLRMKVTAEGIETREQLEKLMLLGCDFGQGYYFSKPIPSFQVELPFQLSTPGQKYSVPLLNVDFSNPIQMPFSRTSTA